MCFASLRGCDGRAGEPRRPTSSRLSNSISLYSNRAQADSQTLLAALQLAASALPAVSVKACKCRDKCERAPVVELSGGGGRELLTNVSAEQVEAILARLRPKAPPP